MLTQDEAEELAYLVAQVEAENARRSLLAFIQYVWWSPHPFVIGPHTKAICAALDHACDEFEAGRSSFLDIGVPFRHGKSDMVSRALPAYFLGRFATKQPDVIMSGYGSSLVEGFGRDAKRIIEGEAYRNLFPAVSMSASVNNAAEWQVAGSVGKVTCAGLGGAITGKGGALIVLDDYCKSREEAESATYREKTWDQFTNDLLTRRAPVSIVIVCATPWHTDDIRGRIRSKEKEDQDFPKFARLVFPARNPDGSFLFTERYAPSWYLEQYATLGRYGSSGLLDCNPTVQGGNIFRMAGVQYEDPAQWEGLRWTRAWDMASTSKQLSNTDPDWTCGVLGAIRKEKDQSTGAMLDHLYVRDVVLLREEAPARDARIRQTAESDGQSIPIGVEAWGGYKDAATSLKAALKGQRVVRELRPPGDKRVKASPLQPIFDAGHVHVPKGATWLPEWIKQFEEFDGGSHDDCIDATALIWHAQTSGNSLWIPGRG